MYCLGRRWFLLGNNADWRVTFCHPPIALWDLFFDQVLILISSATHLYGVLPWKINPNGAKIFLKRDTGIIGPLDFKMLEKTLHDCTVIKVPCS